MTNIRTNRPFTTHFTNGINTRVQLAKIKKYLTITCAAKGGVNSATNAYDNSSNPNICHSIALFIFSASSRNSCRFNIGRKQAGRTVGKRHGPPS